MANRINTNIILYFMIFKKHIIRGWCNGLWLKLWNMGVKRKMWHVIILRLCISSRSAVLLEGEKSSTFSVEQGVA